MLDLFKNYPVSEIIIFVIVLALAVEKLVKYIDWAIGRIKQAYKKGERIEKLSEEQKANDEQDKKLKQDIEQMKEQIELLIASDRDDIKAFIVKEHHYFCYERKWIDDYSLDCLEKRYSHYKAEGGNSFIKDMMFEIRQLPKQPPQDN